jgi:hypothetical protein
MKRLTAIAMLVCAGALGSCDRTSQTDEIVLDAAEVGDKTDLYEVVATNRLKLAPGVTMQPTVGPCGESSAMLLTRQNGETGGYVVCSCLTSTPGNCKTTNDNPEYASCEGGCTNSEGRRLPCQVSEPLPGPPKNPLMIRLRAP